MIDLPLMAKLVEAVPPQARLILLGDKDQLVSVQVGAVLGDIYCPDSLWSEQAGQALQSTPTAAGKSPSPMAACVVELSRSYRYDERSGIGALARAIKAGDVELALRVLRDETGMPYGDVALAELDEQAPLAGPLGVAVRAGFGGWFALEDPAARLACLSRFRILCAHRQGPFGVQALNDLVERCLREELGIQTEALHYDGRPILVTQNDYQLGLFNGDVGVVMVDGQGRARVYFESADGPPRSVAAGRMPPHETVYAMSVHKSQGSELDRVALLMPRSSSPILTRELIYTGISRARSRVDLFGNEQVLREALSRRVERASGIRDALWSPAGAGW